MSHSYTYYFDSRTISFPIFCGTFSPTFVQTYKIHNTDHCLNILYVSWFYVKLVFSIWSNIWYQYFDILLLLFNNASMKIVDLQFNGVTMFLRVVLCAFLYRLDYAYGSGDAQNVYRSNLTR